MVEINEEEVLHRDPILPKGLSGLILNHILRGHNQST